MSLYTTLVRSFISLVCYIRNELNIAIKIVRPDEDNWQGICSYYEYEYKTLHSNIVPNFHLSGLASSYRGGRGSSR